MVFESKAPQLVWESIQKQLEQERLSYEHGCQMLTDYYVGGEELASKCLKRHTNEKDEEWESRLARFMSLNYVKRVANAMIDGVYGERVERTIDQELTAELFDDIYLYNSMHRKMRECMRAVVTLGDCYVRAWWNEELEQLRYAVLRPQDILPVPRGDDVERLQALIERRHERAWVNGEFQDMQRYFVWTEQEFGELHVSKDGKLATFAENGEGKREMEPNRYGCIPYAHWKADSLAGQYGGISMIRDAVTIQREINNRGSVNSIVILMQGFSPMVVEGDLVSKLTASETGFLGVSKGGKIYYLQPGAPITEVEGSIDKLIERMCDCSGVPVSAVRGGTANSGIQLAIEMKPLADIVEGLKTQAGESERELFEHSLKVLKAHGQKVSVEASMTPNFPESFLPTDTQAELANNLLKIQSNLMSRKRFLQEEDPDLTDEQAEEKLAEIDAEAAKGRQARTGLQPMFGKPPSLVEEEGEE